MQTDIDVDKIRKKLEAAINKCKHCVDINSKEMAKSISLKRQALSLLKGQPCETCGGSGELPNPEGLPYPASCPNCPAGRARLDYSDCKGTGQALQKG